MTKLCQLKLYTVAVMGKHIYKIKSQKLKEITNNGPLCTFSWKNHSQNSLTISTILYTVA